MHVSVPARSPDERWCVGLRGPHPVPSGDAWVRRDRVRVTHVPIVAWSPRTGSSRPHAPPTSLALTLDARLDSVQRSPRGEGLAASQQRSARGYRRISAGSRRRILGVRPDGQADAAEGRGVWGDGRTSRGSVRRVAALSHLLSRDSHRRASSRSAVRATPWLRESCQRPEILLWPA